MSDKINSLIGRSLSGNATPQDSQELTQWLKEDSSNQAEFDRLKKIWEVSATLKKERNTDVENAWTEFKVLAAQPEKKIIRPTFSYMKVAAGIALIACLTVVLSLIFTDNNSVPQNITALQSPPIVAPAPAQDETPEKIATPDSFQVIPAPIKPRIRNKKIVIEQAHNIALITLVAGDTAKAFLLPDNTIVFLNEHSTLTYPDNFSKNNRKLSLTGEAYFEFSRDTMQFIVACKNTITKGISGSFNIKGYPDSKEVEVIIVSGSAEFSGVGKREYKKLILKQGDRGTFDSNDKIVKAKNQRKDYKWWQKKNLRMKFKKLIERIKNKFK